MQFNEDFKDADDPELQAAKAADACRARLSKEALAILGSDLPESFINERYVRDREYFNRTYPAQIAEIFDAIGKSDPRGWNFEGLTSEETTKVDPRSLRFKSDGQNSSVLPPIDFG